MTTKAASKGRAFQRKVRDIIKSHLGLDDDDIRTPVGCEAGEDIKLSKHGRGVFPFSIECKKYASFAIYKHYEQATKNKIPGTYPLLVVEGDRKKPLAIMEFDHFIELITKGT